YYEIIIQRGAPLNMTIPVCQRRQTRSHIQHIHDLLESDGVCEPDSPRPSMILMTPSLALGVDGGAHQ
ncbi:hypothetical protein KXV92_003864, partial [Aspergillus fumigatus]